MRTQAVDRRARLEALLGRDEAPPRNHFDLVEPLDVFSESVAPATPARRIAAADLPGVGPFPDTVAIEFPEGTTRFDPITLRRVGGPQSATRVALIGAGIDKSLVVLDDTIALSGESSISFRDLTIDCNDRCFVAGSHSTLFVRLDRCRVVGFDGGHAGSQFLRGGAAAVIAIDSRIESGFGRSPGLASLFNTSPGTSASGRLTLARFERCVFRGPFEPGAVFGHPFFDLSSAVTCLFSNCAFEETAAGDRTALESPGAGVQLRNCSVQFASESPVAPARQRKLSELNPGWSRSAPR